MIAAFRSGQVSVMPRVGRSILLMLVLSSAVTGLICREASSIRPAQGQTTKMELGKYSVDGLALDSTVHPTSSVYREYDCVPSTQFEKFTVCRRKKIQSKPGGDITLATTIYHGEAGTLAYVTRFIEPAFFKPKEVDEEIDRLSAKYGQKPQLLQAPQQPGG